MSDKLDNFNSPEKKVLLEYFQNIPMMDKWIASVIENYIYAYVEEYGDNRQLKCKYRTKYGEKDGEYKAWWDKGQLGVQKTYVEDKLYGEYKEWHSNGQLYTQTTYVEGKLHGEYKGWNSNGQLYIQSTFVEGKEIKSVI